VFAAHGARRHSGAVADVFSIRKRSEVMRAIRSSGNRSTELRLVQLLRQWRISGWRRGRPLPGRPDLVFPKERIAVFVDGCFWHGCPQHGRTPRSRQGYWREKLARNRARDREAARLLREKGWRVLRFWEHDLPVPAKILRRLGRALAQAPASGRPADAS
jgi:DNA mismatch endonuclease (patch repair protein)